ncbi:MAG: hypothetical protein WDO17_02685 [Alphaproteobacteria bacterium]
MKVAVSTDLVRKNLTLYRRTEHRLDKLRELAECSSDSEVIRQSLRYFEQFVEDWRHQRPVVAVRTDGSELEITMHNLDEANIEGEPFVRRNLTVHPRSVERLEALQRDSELDSESETVRYALKLFEILLTEAERQSRFFVGRRRERVEVRIGNISATAAVAKKAQGGRRAVG